jgi:hypothetical protein
MLNTADTLRAVLAHVCCTLLNVAVNDGGKLCEDSAMSHALQIRGTDTSKMKGKQKQEYERLKRNLTPVPALSEEEKEAIDAFWAHQSW